MFYYISFLRPPSLTANANPSEPILITPQISNDLRTEYFNDPIDIYYAWSLHAPHLASPVATKPAKLTSWRPSTAYKEIPVPRPPPLEPRTHTSTDPEWRLILTCGTMPRDRIIVLGETDTTGNAPFAVMSMPVRFLRRPAHGTGNKGMKQERIARSYALRVPFQDRPIVFDITEQTSFDLDKKIWDSGIGLSSWLVHLFLSKVAETDTALSELRDALFSTDPRHILELGAGTGIVAITVAVLRSTLDLAGLDQPGSIVTTDLPSAIPILQENIAANHVLTSKCAPQVTVLDWDHDDLAPLVQSQLDTGLNIIVMADVTYNTASFSALIATLARVVQRGKQKRNDERLPRVLMGYKERHPDERSLWDCAKEIGLHFRQIAQINGAGGHPVEIWLA